jgi:pyruvate dehydrogenase complex dehydrogenase (E1) component
MSASTDPDILETSEWIDSLRAVLQHRGTDRAAFLIEYLTDEAQRAGGIRLGADQQLGGASGDAAHGFNGVDDQVQDRLLQLDHTLRSLYH